MMDKHYPLHPGQTHATPLYTQLPLEEYEALMKENKALKQANANLAESIAELDAMRLKEVELEMRERELDERERELKKNGVYINYWIDAEVEKPAKEYAGMNFVVTNGRLALIAVWGENGWYENPFKYMQQSKITYWCRLPRLPEAV